MKIRPAVPGDAEVWDRMRNLLWPGTSHRQEVEAFFAGTAKEPAIVFVAEQNDGTLCGFAEVSIRHDYVEGASSSPVAYLEGWYVEPGFRGQGIGKHLFEFAEVWAAESGFSEFGSDVSAENKESLKVHLASGFRIVGTAVHFMKTIDRGGVKS